MGILSKIREIPEGQKKIISFFVAGIITVTIVTAWSSFGDNVPREQETGNKLSSISPAQVIKDEISKAVTDIKGIFGNSTTESTSTLSTSTIPIEIVSDAVVGTSTDNSMSTTSVNII